MLKVEQNPPQRWPEGRLLIDDCGKWWILYTKPRNEKALAWDMKQLGIGYCLPMMTKRTIRRDNGKTRKSVVCMFPSYLPCVDYPKFRLDLLRTGRMVKAIEVQDQVRFVQELDNIYRVCSNNIDFELHSDLAVGKRVYITNGPFEGTEGIISEIGRDNQLFLNVEMFHRSISIKINPSSLMPII